MYVLSKSSEATSTHWHTRAVGARQRIIRQGMARPVVAFAMAGNAEAEDEEEDES